MANFIQKYEEYMRVNLKVWSKSGDEKKIGTKIWRNKKVREAKMKNLYIYIEKKTYLTIYLISH